jgi:glycosyltransferase involved in cell wall biosynthesis
LGQTWTSSRSLVTSVTAPGWFDQGTYIDINICQGNILTMQRNELVNRVRGDWLMFIDDDMVWHPGQIAQLVKTQADHDLDMVGALCYRRSAPHQPTMFMREGPTSGAFNFLEDWEDGAVIEVDATGMAFVIIHKRVFERIVAFHEHRPGWKMPPYEERVTSRPPNFFRWLGGYGEDLQFCIDAKLSGSKIFVDTSVEIDHVAEVQINRRHFLSEIANRDPEVETERRRVNTDMGLPTLSREEAKKRLGLDG